MHAMSDVRQSLINIALLKVLKRLALPGQDAQRKKGVSVGKFSYRTTPPVICGNRASGRSSDRARWCYSSCSWRRSMSAMSAAWAGSSGLGCALGLATGSQG